MNLIFRLFLLVALATGLRAETSWVQTPAFVSQYMFRGVRLNGPAFQPSLEFDAGNLALGVWANAPLKGRVTDQSSTEVDWYASYTIAASDTLSYVAGFTAYTYPNAHRSDGTYRATFEPSLALVYTAGDFTLTSKVYYDLTLRGPTGEVTAAYSVPLKGLKTSLDLTATYGAFRWLDIAPGADTKNWGTYYLVSVALPFQVTERSKLILGAAYTAGSGNYLKTGTAHREANDAALGRAVYSLSYSVTF